MLIISGEARRRIKFNLFQENCKKLLIKNYSKKLVRNKGLDKFIRVNNKSACNYGFKSELSRFRFIHVSYLLGRGFEEKYPIVKNILRRIDISPNDRSYYLEQIVLSMYSEVSSTQSISTQAESNAISEEDRFIASIDYKQSLRIFRKLKKQSSEG